MNLLFEKSQMDLDMLFQNNCIIKSVSDSIKHKDT